MKLKRPPYRRISLLLVCSMLLGALPIQQVEAGNAIRIPKISPKPPAPPAAADASGEAPTPVAPAAPAAPGDLVETCDEFGHCEQQPRWKPGTNAPEIASRPVLLAPPGVVAPPPASAPGVPALCDAENGGLGGEIVTWPDYMEDANSEFQKKAKKFEEDAKQRILTQGSQLHLRHNTAGQAIDLTTANKARETYFRVAFAKNAATVRICTYRKQFAAYIEKYFDKQKDQDDLADGDACAGSFQEMDKAYQSAKEHLEALERELKELIEGKPGRDGKTRPGLESIFQKSREANRINLDAHKAKISALQVSPSAWEQYEQEFFKAWGPGPAQAGKDSLRSGGAFSDHLLQTKEERKAIIAHRKAFEQESKKMVKLQKDCAAAAPAAVAPPSGDPAPAPVPPPPAGGPASPSSISPPTIADGPPAGGQDAPPPAGGQGAPPPPAGADGPLAGGRDGGGPLVDGGAFTMPPDDLNRRSPQEPPLRGQPIGGPGAPPPSSGGVADFLADNWLWIAGGTAAVGGGYYLYKKDQDRKKEQRYWDNYVPPPKPKTSGSSTDGGTTSTSSSGTISTPAGSKIIIVNSIGSAAAGETVPPLEVALVNPSGMQLSDSNTTIEVSCYHPQPCSLTGGKSVSTVNGRASFTTLKFNQPHNEVRLQFSAPGFPTVTTPNAFNVTGSAQRE